MADLITASGMLDEAEQANQGEQDYLFPLTVDADRGLFEADCSLLNLHRPFRVFWPPCEDLHLLEARRPSLAVRRQPYLPVNLQAGRPARQASRSARMSNFPLGSRGKASTRQMYVGILKAARRWLSQSRNASS